LGKLRVMGTSLSPHLFHPTYKYWLDSPTATRVGPPHRSSLAQTYSSSCTSCFGKLAHLLALSAIRCSFFIAPAPLHSKPSEEKISGGVGIWTPCRSVAICSSLLKGDLPLNLPPTAWGTLLSPLLFHPTYKYWLDSPTATRVGPPHRSSLAQTYTSSCTSCFGQRAHLLALSAIRCSFFIAPAPLHSNPLLIKKKGWVRGFGALVSHSDSGRPTA